MKYFYAVAICTTLLAASASISAPTQAATYQTYCNKTTCFLQLNRAETFKVASRRPVTGATLQLCTRLTRVPLPYPTQICVRTVQSRIHALSSLAKRYYTDGDCIAFSTPKFYRPGQPVSPYRMRKGVTNC